MNTAGVGQLPSSNHHKADAKIIEQAIQSNDSNLILVVASYTDILVPLIYAIDKLSLDNIPHRVQRKIDDEKFVSVNNICRNLL